MSSAHIPFTYASLWVAKLETSHILKGTKINFLRDHLQCEGVSKLLVLWMLRLCPQAGYCFNWVRFYLLTLPRTQLQAMSTENHIVM